MTLNRLMLPTRLPHRCEIRTGDQAPTRGGKTRPNRLEHFRITGPKEICEAVADVYGGEPRPWEGAPTPGAWEVYTNTDTLHVAVPINMPDVLDGPMWELWTAGGRVRRCDGQTCETTRVEGDQAVTESVPCMCNPDEPECKATTRLRVIITTIPGVGTDRLVTHSIHAGMEIPGVLEFLRLSGASGLVPAYLRIQTKTVKRTGQQTKTFPVVTLDPQVQTAALLAGDSFRDATWTQHRAQLADYEGSPGRLNAAQGRPVIESGEVSTADYVAARWDELKAAWPGDTASLVAALKEAGITGREMLADPDHLQHAHRVVAAATAMPRLDPDDEVDAEIQVHPDQERLA